MKKILVVGGGVNQIPLILASKREGFDVAVVDYAGENCPAFTIADRFYTVSTQDESAVLEVAKEEKVDGIISNSEPSMLVVNSIAEKLNLTGNPVAGIKNLMSKSRFRDLQKRTGIFVPDHYEVAQAEEAVFVSERLGCPIIIKPCESSGSRGCRVVERLDCKEITAAFLDCKNYSRNKRVVIEEYIAMPSLQTIEGDIFVIGDYILWDGLFFTTRASWAPLVPMTYTAPILIDEVKMDKVRSAISRVLKASGIRFGVFNIEGFFTKTGEFFVIEINVRQGGNLLPGFLQRFTGIDYNRLLVTTCVNDDCYFNSVMTTDRCPRYSIMHSVYSQKEGKYKGLIVDALIKDKVTKITELVEKGDKVERCIDGTSIVASIDLEFDSMEELYDFTPRIMNSIHVELSDIS